MVSSNTLICVRLNSSDGVLNNHNILPFFFEGYSSSFKLLLGLGGNLLGNVVSTI